MRLFLIDPAPGAPAPAAGDTVRLSPEESRHLLRALRAEPGFAIELSDGRGLRCRGELAGSEGGRAAVRLLEVAADASELAGPRLELGCALIRGPRFEWAVEKAAELGAHRLLALACERGVVSPREGRRERWEAVARAAQKQCGRAWRPEVHGPMPLAEALAPAGPGSGRMAILYGELLGDAVAVATPRDLLALPGWAAGALPDRLLWLVGPEGDWSERERALLAAAGAIAVTLGPHRLRSETAAVAGLALLRALVDAPAKGRAAGPA